MVGTWDSLYNECFIVGLGEKSCMDADVMSARSADITGWLADNFNEFIEADIMSAKSTDIVG